MTTLLQGMWVDGSPCHDSGSHANEELTVIHPVMPEDPSWFWSHRSPAASRAS